jgi:hypothetical protein
MPSPSLENNADCWDKKPKLFTLNTGIEGRDTKVQETRGISINSKVSHQCAPEGSIYRVSYRWLL